MKFVVILYALIGIGVQVLVGEVTGLGQGSIGILTFLFLVEVDPRLRFSYMVPNIQQRYLDHKETENKNE